MNKEMSNNREIACDIVELFDELLNQKGIEIPCESQHEEAERHLGNNEAKLYGLEFWNLVDQIQSILDDIP